jgi:hypothetical protein
VCAMNGPAGKVVGLAAHRRTADRQQADYYWRLLEDLRVQVHEELAEHFLMLAKHQRAGDLSGVKRVPPRARQGNRTQYNQLFNQRDRKAVLPVSTDAALSAHASASNPSDQSDRSRPSERTSTTSAPTVT